MARFHGGRLTGPELGSSLLIPILLYHHIGEGPQEDRVDLYRGDLWLPPERLEEQLRYFRHAGYRFISLNQAVAHVKHKTNLPARPVALTFDDGYADNYSAAFPLLRSYGATAAFFVPSDLVGSPGYVTWRQLEEMAACGMAIEGHSAAHVSLTSLGAGELRRQLEACRFTIETKLGRPVQYFAYPGGHFNNAVIAATRAAGYKAAFTTLPGITLRPGALFELPRVRVRSTDTAAALAARMSADSAWSYTFERVLRRFSLWKPWKKVRRRVGALGIHRRRRSFA